MADLPYIKQAQEVKITGQDSSGAQVNYAGADANGNLLVKDYADGPVTPGAVASTSTLIGAQYNTTLPTLTNTQQAAVQVDSSGRVLVGSIANALPAGSNTIGAVNQGNAGSQSWLTTDLADGPVSVGTAATKSMLMGGQYNSTLPSPSNTQQMALQLDYRGRVITAPSSFNYFHPIFTTLVQSNGNANSSNGTTLSTTLSKSSTSGNLIVVTASASTGSLTCTDNLSQTYSTAVTTTTAGDVIYTFYKANTASGVTTLTITNGSSTAMNMIVTEYSNISSTPLDQTQSNLATSTSFTSNATSATTQANELLIGATFDRVKNNVTITPGKNWIAINTIQNGVGAAGGTLFQQEQFVQTTGAYASTGTISANDAYLATIATFKISPVPANLAVVNQPLTIKSGAGTLSGVTINKLGTSNSSVTFYDSLSASGTVIANLSLTSLIGQIGYNLKFSTGLTMVVNSTTPDFTVTYD